VEGDLPQAYILHLEIDPSLYVLAQNLISRTNTAGQFMYFLYYYNITPYYIFQYTKQYRVYGIEYRVKKQYIVFSKIADSV